MRILDYWLRIVITLTLPILWVIDRIYPGTDEALASDDVDEDVYSLTMGSVQRSFATYDDMRRWIVTHDDPLDDQNAQTGV